MSDGSSGRRRILIVGLNYAPEPIGIGPYTTGLAEHLAARGWRVAVVAGKPYYPQWRSYPGFGGFGYGRASENGVTVTRCPHYVPAHPGGARRIVHHLSFALSALPVVLAHAVRRRPDIVLCITPSLVSAPIARLAAWLGGARLWLHVQDFEVDAAVATGLVRGGALSRLLVRIERALLRSADLVSTIGPKMVARLIVKGVVAKRTYELRNWASVAADASGEAYRGEWNLRGKTVALYSGSIGRKQGAGLILDAARQLAHRGDIAFVICGEGPELAELREGARDLANVAFHPLQPAHRLGELLALADVNLLPQVAGAADLVLPSKLTNMLASGRPVIATAAPGTGLAEEIEDCGIAVSPGDAGALAAAIVRVAGDPALAARLGAAAKARAAERWSREAILNGLEARLSALAAVPLRP